MLFKLASERPSEVTGARLSVSTSHSRAFEEAQNERSGQSKWRPYQLKNWFPYLPCQGPPGAPQWRWTSHCGGAARIPGPPQASIMAISGVGAPLPLWDWGQSHFRWPVLLQTRDGPGGSFWHFWAQWLIDLHLKHSPLLVLPPGRWLNFLGPLGLSCGCKTWLKAMAISLAWALACLFLHQVLSSSWAWSRLLNTSKATSRSWGMGFVGLIVTFGVSA